MKKKILWALARGWGRPMITTVAFVVLARRLPTEAFGIFATAYAIVALVRLAADQGLTDIAVQTGERRSRVLAAALWTNLGGAALLSGLLFAVAGVLGSAFNEPAVADAVRWLSPLVLIAGLSAGFEARLLIDGRVDALAARTLVASVVGAVTAVLASLLLSDVGPLLMQALTIDVVGLAALVFALGVPRWRKPAFRELFPHLKEGGVRVGSRFASVGSTYADDLIVAAMLGVGPLGFYSVAYRFLSVAVQASSEAIALAVFPEMARRKREEEGDFSGLAAASHFGVAMLALPIFAGLGLLAAPLLAEVFGRQWLPAVPVLRWLAFAGAATALQGVAVATLLALGENRLVLQFQILNLLSTAVAAAVGSAIGTVRDVALAMAIQSLVALGAVTVMQRHVVQPRIAVAAWMTPLAATLVMALGVYLVGLGPLDAWSQLAILPLVGIALYSLVLWLIGGERLQAALAYYRGER